MSDSSTNKPAHHRSWCAGGSGSSQARALDDENAGAAVVVVASREENDAAELVLEQLDEQWFCDNVVRWPSSRPGSPPGVIDKETASPFRRLPSGLSSSSSSTTQSDVATGVAQPRPRFVGPTLNPPRARHHEDRRLSDGDHHLRRYHERDAILPRRRIPDDPHPHPLPLSHRRSKSTDLSNSPETPTLRNPSDQTRFCSEASTMEDVFSPLALPPAGPLMGVTEDEELENDLFAKMLANRPAKLTTINPGRFSRGSLQENGTEQPQTGKLSKPSSSSSSSSLSQRQPRRRLKGTKSLTDLEYEELRGLKDLGFEVSKDDLTPHVVRMFPGLQRQGIPPYNSPQAGIHSQGIQSQNVTHGGPNVFSQSRFPPVQHLLWPRRPDSPVTNTPFLDPSIDMKGQLKSWASEMASIVSIEC